MVVLPRLAKALAIPARSALSAGSTVVDWLTLGVLGVATVALAISTLRPPAKGAASQERPHGGLFKRKPTA